MIKIRYFFLLFFALLFFPLLLRADGVEYTVEVTGVEDASVARTVRAVSTLVQLRKRPPNSLSSLHFRGESDLPDIKKVLHSYGYYESRVDLHFEERMGKFHVAITIDPGPVYSLGKFTVQLTTRGEENPTLQKKLSLTSLGLQLNKPALSKELIEAELNLFERLANFGYPLASILKRDVIANGDTKEVETTLTVDSGPYSLFGPLSIKGLTTTSARLIKRKLEWKECDPYKTLYVQRTQDALIKTGLFTSVLVSHADEVEEGDQLPMHIEVTESKHHSVNLGVSYQTFFGPGLTFGWENRNISGMGRRLSIQGDLTKRSHSGTAQLFLPDFYHKGQNYIWQAQAMHESITAYSQRTYNLLTRLERQFGRRFSSSIGLKLERLYVTGSVKNGRFLLFEIPIYTRWSSANSLLNPTKGATLDWRIVPSMNIENINTYFLEQELRLSHYLPLNESQSVVFAQKVTLGSIISPRLRVVPVSKRFLGGSEEELRGYKYKTVSLLTNHDKPIGGRSAVYYTFETRFRVTKSIGLVPFFDIGNVYATQFPMFDGKWLKSVGLGVRYFTFIGPFRFDVGFPLNRRKGLDPRYRVLVSIGQSF